MERVDEIFANAVQRGIVFRGMDTKWESDLSGMSFPVARAACRYIVQRARLVAEENWDSLQDVVMITGVGVAQQRRHGPGNAEDRIHDDGTQDRKRSSSLREYVQEVLRDDFDPPIESEVPRLAQGTVEVRKESLRRWIKKQDR